MQENLLKLINIMSQSWLILFLWCILTITLAWMGWRLVRQIGIRTNLELKEQFKSAIDHLVDIRQTKVADAIEAKRNNFLNIPNISFHYVDKEQVTNFYNDYFRVAYH